MKSFKNWGRATMEFTKDHKLTHSQLSALTEFCQWLAEETRGIFILMRSEDGTPLSGYTGKAERINLFLEDKN